MKEKTVEEMPVIDVHGHPAPRGYSQRCERASLAPLTIPGKPDYVYPKTREEATSKMVQEIKEMVKEMDYYKIDKRVLLSLGRNDDEHFHFGETDPKTGVTSATSFEWINKAKELYPQRFEGFICVDPFKKDALKVIENAVIDHGYRGVKLFTARHNIFEPNDRRVYPVYEKCIELDVPAAFHMGASPHKTDHLRLHRPLLLDEVAFDLPELKIIICHAGGNFMQEGTMVAWKNENVYVDISWMHTYCQRMIIPIEPSTAIKRIVSILGPEKVMYGTDNGHEVMNKMFIVGLELGEDACTKILAENAARLLKISLISKTEK